MAEIHLELPGFRALFVPTAGMAAGIGRRQVAGHD